MVLAINFAYVILKLIIMCISETVSTSSSGALSINYPAVVSSSSSSSSGGSYTPGIFKWPYLMLHGVSASTLNIIIALLIIAYVGSIFLPLLNVAPLLNQLAGEICCWLLSCDCTFIK